MVNYFYSPKSRHLKREAYTAFRLTGTESFETSHGTTFISSGSTWEKSHGTISLGTNGQSTTKTEITFVQLDVRELEIPYDVIIGRPDIRQHQLLRFDPELRLTGLNNTDRVIQPELITQVPPVVPATEYAE